MGVRGFSVALVLVATIACGGIIDPSKNTVESFSGTLAVGGSATFNYTFGKNGEVEVTMTSVTPTPPSPISMAIGQVINGTCQLLGGFYVAPGVVNRKNQFGVLNKGTYCLYVFDPGSLTGPVSFAGNFSHP